MQKYEKACFEKLSNSKSGRRAFEFVRAFYNVTTLFQEAGGTLPSE